MQSRAGLASKNIVADIERRTDLPTEHPKLKIRSLTHAQLLGLAERTGQFETLTLVLGYCGIRFGEAAALRRGSVKDGKLNIRESATNVAGQGMVTTRTKTGKERDVAVPPPVWKRQVANCLKIPPRWRSRSGGRVITPRSVPATVRPRRQDDAGSAAARRQREAAEGDLDKHGTATYTGVPHHIAACPKAHGGKPTHQGRGEYQGGTTTTRSRHRVDDVGPLRPSVQR